MTSSDSKYTTFVAGLLLGTTVAAGCTYLALKYAPRISYDSQDDDIKPPPKRRTHRPTSPMPRHNIRRNIIGSSHDTNPLQRTVTQVYYSDSPPEDNGHHKDDIDPIKDHKHKPSTNPSIPHVGSVASLPRAPTNTTINTANRPPRPSPHRHHDPQDLPTDGLLTETDVQLSAELDQRGILFSETEMHSNDAIRGSAIFAGPADRANPAVAGALRHTGAAPNFAPVASPIGSPMPHHYHTHHPSLTMSHQHHHHHLSGMQLQGAMSTPGSTTKSIMYAENTPGSAVSSGIGRSPLSGHHHHNHNNSSMHQTSGPSAATPGGMGALTSAATPGVGGGPTSMVPLSPLNGGGGGGVLHGAQQQQQQQQGSNHPMTTADFLATEGRIIEDAALHEQYSRVITPEPPPTEETEEVCYLLQKALECRKKWLYTPAARPEQLYGMGEAHTMRECLGDPFHWEPVDVAPYTCEMVDGVMSVMDPNNPSVTFFPAPGTATDFFSDLHWLLKITSLGHVRSFTHHRLQLLEQKFNLHVMLNADKEFLAQKSAPHRDFYNVRKIDTHVHHSACMHQKHLLRFIKSKLKKEADEVVIFRDGKYLTLKEVFESLNLTPHDLSVDTLDVHADKNIFHRFDKFNLKYNPFGQSRLREVFIKQDNLIHGRFLAELTREVFADLEASKYQHTEYRISVYGRKPVEWDTLAAWVVQNRLYSDNNVWMIQIPRLYNVYKEQGIIESFEQLLHNIFAPLFEVTLDPDSHPMLHIFLRHVSGFDLVDDESKPERRPTKHMPTPREWTSKHNPAYSYYAYYMYANLYVLNKLREARGFSTFSLRPHSGEAGDLDHLAAAFLLAENIAHGINLRKSPALQHLFYTAQVGLCMSPLSNNSLFLDYHRNPFPQFFARGLSVSLSTDDPLQIHLTREPLVEEYSVAAQVWKLSATDLCEIARNSVLHSGFPPRLKMHWVHTEYWKSGPEGNNIQKTNVPALRMVFRKDCHGEEVMLIAGGAAAHAARLRAKEAFAMQD